MKAVIEAINIQRYYARGRETVKAVDGISMNIKQGEIVSIVGPSGSGKTTLLNVISCLDTPTQGAVKISGEDVTHYNEAELVMIRRINLGFIFQRFYLIPTLTAAENIELPLIFSKKTIDRKATTGLLEKVGLSGKESIQATMLSGGDRQKIAIARALINNPKLLIADEPTGSLETQIRDSIEALFRKLAASGLAVIIATHDLELAQKADRMLHIQDGVIVSRDESNLYW